MIMLFQMVDASAVASGYGLDIFASAVLRNPCSTLMLPIWVLDWSSARQSKLYKRLCGNLDSIYMIDEKDVRIRLPAYSLS
jgi:hypothetical protein